MRSAGNKISLLHSPEREYMHPYYIKTIEIGLFWAKIIYVKSHAIALDSCFQIDMRLPKEKSQKYPKYEDWLPQHSKPYELLWLKISVTLEALFSTTSTI